MTTTGLPKTESRAQFAARLGVARSTITRAVQAGRLIQHENGHILVGPSIKRWHETKAGRTDMEAHHAENRGAAIPEADISQKNATAARKTAKTRNNTATESETTETGSRTSYKGIVLKFENDLIKLEMALRRGQRYPIDHIKNEAVSIGGTLRAGLERLIDQAVPRLAMTTSPAIRLQILEKEARHLARLIKCEFPRALRRMQRQAKKA